MRRAIIYQVGRLDFNAFNELEFEINNKIFKTSLSSFALKDFFKNEGYEAKVILLYPVSLPFNSSLINAKFESNCNEDCYKQLQRALNRPEEYLKDPSEFFNVHPHSKEVEYKILYSLGDYITLSNPVKFNCYYQDIVLMILMDMIERYLSMEDSIEKIIIDISSGHNIYISALIESLKYLGTFIKLSKWNGKIPATEIAFSDPIIPGITQYKIHTEEQNIKVFFSSPIKNEDLQNYRLARSIYPKDHQKAKKSKLQSLLESFAIVFSAIKNNTPLAIYTFDYHNTDDIVKILKELIDDVTDKLAADYTSSPNLNKTDYIKATLFFAFYLGLCKSLKQENISDTAAFDVDIKNIRKSFRNIYKVFNLDLNDVVLGNEVDKVEKSIKEDTEWSLLLSLLYSGDKNSGSPQKRNFFAHAGFEGNVTECKKQEDKLYLRYNETHKEKIKKWLKESV